LHGRTEGADSASAFSRQQNARVSGRQGAARRGQASGTERQMASKTINPFTFLQQVRTETAKVTWPSRRETMISTMMVVMFAFIAAIFFFAADQVMAYGVELILGIGR
jgi:preprotein translocase subunit SecE